MIPQYSFRLKFSVDEIINPDWKNPAGDEFFVKNYDSPNEWKTIITPKFLDLLDSTLPIVRLMVFNKPKSWTFEDAHVDPGILYALNVVQTVKNSNAKMQWFDVIGQPFREISYSSSDTLYVNYKQENLNLVHEELLDNTVSIVQTNVPHRIKIGTSSRTCISFRFRNKFKSWDEVYNFYQSLGWVLN
jgi:hypothetical protein